LPVTGLLGTTSPIMLISAQDVVVADINPFKYAESFAALVSIDAVRGFELTIGELQVKEHIERTGERLRGLLNFRPQHEFTGKKPCLILKSLFETGY